MKDTIKKFNEERTYGVEIEFQGNRDKVAELMRAAGVPAYVEGYNHETKHHWKLITDSSAGFELVSPILKGRDGLRQLEIACKALNQAECQVDRRCGFHVHHGVDDLAVKDMANIFAIYTKLEKSIDKFLPASRRANNNDYCRSLFQGSSQQAILNRIKEVKTISDLTNLFSTRYLKVNAQSYLRHGTIEFRQHSGTLDYAKMSNWIMFTQQIIERAKYPTTMIYREEKADFQSVKCTLLLSEAYGATEEISKVFSFLKKRAKQLAA